MDRQMDDIGVIIEVLVESRIAIRADSTATVGKVLNDYPLADFLRQQRTGKQNEATNQYRSFHHLGILVRKLIVKTPKVGSIWRTTTTRRATSSGLTDFMFANCRASNSYPRP